MVILQHDEYGHPFPKTVNSRYYIVPQVIQYDVSVFGDMNLFHDIFVPPFLKIDTCILCMCRLFT